MTRLREELYRRIPDRLSFGILPYNFVKAKLLGNSACDFPDKASPLWLNISKNDIVLECGSNLGGTTSELVKYAKTVISLEPSPFTFKWTQRRLKGRKNLILLNAAVGAKSEEARDLFMHWQLSGSNSLLKQDNIPYHSLVKVRVYALDELFNLYYPNILIMDCEGAELESLQNCSLLKRIDKVFIETHYINGESTANKIMWLLQKNSFTLHKWKDAGGFTWIIGNKSAL